MRRAKRLGDPAGMTLMPPSSSTASISSRTQQSGTHGSWSSLLSLKSLTRWPRLSCWQLAFGLYLDSYTNNPLLGLPHPLTSGLVWQHNLHLYQASPQGLAHVTPDVRVVAEDQRLNLHLVGNHSSPDVVVSSASNLLQPLSRNDHGLDEYILAVGSDACDPEW